MKQRVFQINTWSVSRAATMNKPNYVSLHRLPTATFRLWYFYCRPFLLFFHFSSHAEAFNMMAFWQPLPSAPLLSLPPTRASHWRANAWRASCSRPDTACTESRRDHTQGNCLQRNIQTAGTAGLDHQHIWTTSIQEDCHHAISHQTWHQDSAVTVQRTNSATLLRRFLLKSLHLVRLCCFSRFSLTHVNMVAAEALLSAIFNMGYLNADET